MTWTRNRARKRRRRKGMRNTLNAAPQRRLVAAALPAGLILIAMAALAGCSSSSSSSAASSGAIAYAPHAAASAASGFSGAYASRATGGSAQSAAATQLAAAGQELIYTAQLTVRAQSVSSALSRATSIAASAGGYVSSENASSNPNHPSLSTATIELKIPVAVYAATLNQLTSSLGTQLSLQQQAQDVTEQVADVNSRVASDEAAIAQLRALLKHAGTVGDLLSVQDQINSEESDLESMQAQQTALNHETSYATVDVSILGPKVVPKPKPAAHPRTPGLISGLGAGWRAFRTSVSWFFAILGAVAPFAAVVAVLGYLAYWIRRRLLGRRSTGGAAD